MIMKGAEDFPLAPFKLFVLYADNNYRLSLKYCVILVIKCARSMP